MCNDHDNGYSPLKWATILLLSNQNNHDPASQELNKYKTLKLCKTEIRNQKSSSFSQTEAHKGNFGFRIKLIMAETVIKIPSMNFVLKKLSHYLPIKKNFCVEEGSRDWFSWIILNFHTIIYI